MCPRPMSVTGITFEEAYARLRQAKPRPGLAETIESYPQRQKKISTKGHEGRRRATKGLEKAQEGSAKGRAGGKDFHEGR